ncbi:hypothetical protein AWV80_38450 [Cupriavidus sp. UYMU48A]|nr:hypothetical protein AWV80_38450 [Cupriavidus sp. UYMU48A]
MDDLGIYYDAARESRLERLISEQIAAAELERAARLVSAWREARLSKYNSVRDGAFASAEPYVLVVDQTRGDCSVVGAHADDASFRAMLDAAIDENPHTRIIVKTHPDVMPGASVAT